MASIPASQIVSVIPSVLPAGGQALDLSGLLLTQDTRVPIGGTLSFPTLGAVTAFFGPTAPETVAAGIYFGGYTGGRKRPGALLFAQFNPAPAAGWLRSAPYVGNLAALQALTGTLGVSINGAAAVVGSLNLSSATSFSAAAALIATAVGAACTFDPIQSVFQIASGTTGAGSSISFATGTLAAALGMTAATGGVLSVGAAAATPAGTMAGVLASTRNWASFSTMWEPLLADKLNFAIWNNSQAGSFLYVPWDTDATATQSGAAGCFGVLAGQAGANYTGVAPVYQSLSHAVFLMGWAASLDFGQRNGRSTAAFRNQPGLVPSVTNATVAANLKANGYNFYGSYATANQAFSFNYPGQTTGPFLWLDTYVDQIWLTNQLQLANMVLLTNAGSIPYNQQGYALIRAAAQDVIDAALNFGAIRSGITLSDQQAALINSQAGLDVAGPISRRGWYYQVLDPTPQVRQNRGTPQCTLWFTDGGSVHQLNIGTVAIL